MSAKLLELWSRRERETQAKVPRRGKSDDADAGKKPKNADKIVRNTPGVMIMLAPPPLIPMQLAILGGLLAPLLFIPGLEWWARIASATMPLIFTGTFRISKIIETRFETRFYFGFVPFRLHKCKLGTVGTILTNYGTSQPGIWTFILFGPLQWILGWVFDFLIPALGGPLEIWLVTAKGREIKAWQGHNQDQFDTNLRLLQNHTTAELRTRVGA